MWMIYIRFCMCIKHFTSVDFVCDIDLSAAVISPLFWLLHPRTFGTRTRRHKHGGNEQQSEERSSMYSQRTCYFGEHGWFISLVGSLNLHHCINSFPSLPFFCLKESLCGQRGLLPNTDIQTFQVSLTSHLRSHYDRIREPFIRVHPALFVKII